MNSYLQNSNNLNTVDNHRASFNIEYKIDTANYIKFNPSFSKNKINAIYYSDFISQINERKISDGSMDDNSLSNSPNFSGSFLYNHRFKKRGRTISFNLNAGSSSTWKLQSPSITDHLGILHQCLNIYERQPIYIVIYCIFFIAFK